MLNHNGDRSLWPAAISDPALTSPGALAALPEGPAGPQDVDAAGVERVGVEGIWHRYGSAGAGDWTLRGVSLSLAAGELVGLLGPSGCGKTTLLRLIAGFETPERGSVRIDGREVAGPGRFLAPERRGVGMVFQDYALFPHLDAVANARFGLARGQDHDRVAWLFTLLGLEGLEQRYPHELSGGQRQRLALVRALAPRPSVVLLDEPFSNLDAEVRERLRGELPSVLAACGACALMVTHDPQEALAISDRVAVLREGELEQCAAPLQLVRRPATSFVARFVLQANLLPAEWHGQLLQTPLGEFERLPDEADPIAAGPDRAGSNPVRSNGARPTSHPLPQICLQPSDLRLLPRLPIDPSSAAPPLEVEVLSREFLGREWLYQVRLGERRLRVRQPLSPAPQRGERCGLALADGAEPLLLPFGWPLRPRIPPLDPGP